MPATTLTSRGKSSLLATELRRGIVEGRLKPGDMLPTQKQLCKNYDVAGNTAFLAMEQLAQEGLIVRIPGRGTFVNEVVARPRTIDFVRVARPANEPQNHTILSYVDAFAELCAERRHRAVWHHLLYAAMDQPEETLRDFAGSTGVVARSVPEPFLRGLHRMGVPVVSIMPRRPQTAAPWPQLDYDRLASAHLVMDHLVAQGYQRIAYVAHGPLGWARGYIESVQRHRLPVPIEWIIEGRERGMADTLDRMRALLKDGSARPDALCCATDADAASVQRELLAMGLRVPEDVAVAACDSGPDAAAPVPITRAGIDIAEVCRLTLDLVESAAPGFHPDAAESDPVLLPVRLTVDRSTVKP